MANIQLYLILFTGVNIFLFINAQYIGSPQKPSDLQVTLKKSLELQCEYTGEDDDGQFIGWFKNDTQITLDKSDHYVIKNHKKETKLTITFAEEDLSIKKWSVKTNKVGQEEPFECQFTRIFVIPSPQRMETNRPNEKLDTDQSSIRRLRDDSISFKCIIQPPQIQKRRIQWQYSNDGQTFSNLPNDIRNISKNEITIDKIHKDHRGYYRCLLNNVTFTALLRVKDPFAALWPFIGIVTIVLIVVVIILVFERRQKLARKAAAAAADDEGNDNANDPLVQPSNKLSDNDNKKTTVQT